MKRLLPVAFLLALLLATPVQGNAQNATPIAGGCTVEPMPQDRIDELVAQAATPAVPVTAAPVDLQHGQPVSDDVQTELRLAIQQVEACAQLQDLPRLLALYSDRFIVEQVFTSEPVQIVRTIDGTPIGGDVPPGATDQQDMLLDALQLPDGRIAATVSSNAWGGDPHLYIFVHQDGRWLIDEIGPVPNDSSAGGASDVTIPANAQSVVDLVIQDAASQLGADPDALSVSAIEAVEWPDASLGCPEEGGVYAQVISPGYRITVTVGATSLEYHTGPNDAFVTC